MGCLSVGLLVCLLAQLRLPEGVVERLKPWSARDVQHWGRREDENLLIGAYKYGFGAWMVSPLCLYLSLSVSVSILPRKSRFRDEWMLH